MSSPNTSSRTSRSSRAFTSARVAGYRCVMKRPRSIAARMNMTVRIPDVSPPASNMPATRSMTARKTSG